MPNPSNYNNKDEFISACMSQVDNEKGKEDWPHDRKLAHCIGIWKSAKSAKQLYKVAKAVDTLKVARAIKEGK